MVLAADSGGLLLMEHDGSLDPDSDSYAIPLPYVQDALDHMTYASEVRVMFRMLALTGCRIEELDRMRLKYFQGEFLWWPLGKNQGGKWRKERLPPDYLDELRAYRETHRVYGDRLFGVAADTFRRYFNRDVRPLLGKAWNMERVRPSKAGFKREYRLQLKGLRKNFQTIHFATEYNKWKDAGVALEFTSKRMKHSTKHITAHHYLENFDALGIKDLSNLDPEKALQQHRQRRLQDFL